MQPVTRCWHCFDLTFGTTDLIHAQLIGGGFYFQFNPPSWKWDAIFLDMTRCLMSCAFFCYIMLHTGLHLLSLCVIVWLVGFLWSRFCDCRASLVLICFSNTCRGYFLPSLVWQFVLSPPENKIKEFCQVSIEEDGTSVNAEKKKPHDQ